MSCVTWQIVKPPQRLSPRYNSCHRFKVIAVDSLSIQVAAVDSLVNNAGIAILDPFLETKWKDFDTVMNVNVRSYFVVGQV